uniref:Ubiquitin thioesterase OTU n=1 Tax=Aegilops tauschii TaxID=37682 RepID=M8CBT5_AEGTA
MPVDRKINCADTSASSSHGKKVYTDYSVTGIPGDGRCLFRSVVHGACIRSGKPIPNEYLQRKLADELRSMVADEFVTRREETEWFVEGDFDTYVSQIRQPHVWGGEPELFMASHVLQMPITVYMHDEDVGGLITIAEYGQEYGTVAKAFDRVYEAAKEQNLCMKRPKEQNLDGTGRKPDVVLFMYSP